jgi:hypothetical protein
MRLKFYLGTSLLIKWQVVKRQLAAFKIKDVKINNLPFLNRSVSQSLFHTQVHLQD